MSSSGTSSTAEFFPGGNLYAGGGGSGGFTSYSSAGLAPLGTLYALVLLGEIVLVILAWSATAQSVGRSRAKWSGTRAQKAASVALLVGIGLGALLAAAVPLLQPPLYRTTASAGNCGSGTAACGPFWGSSHAAGTTVQWGAGLGWWLDVSVVAFLALTWWLRTRKAKGAGQPTPPARGPP
jgi:hypothetical protein